jgi:L-rhamnose mutarotase
LKRYASIVQLKPAAEAEYRRIHAEVWPEVLATIARCQIRNYSIFLRDGILTAYYEYHGADHAADMALMAADPKTQEWWRITNPMQQPVPGAPEGAWWAPLEEVFHFDGGA